MTFSAILSGRPRDIGGFGVRRTLPAPQRRMVGPFVFWDQMGPAELAPGHGIDVRPHPHIGLATVTYLFAGELVHRDSLGNAQTIRAGDVNWMTAGRGIVHSERTGPERRAAGGMLHGIQSWIALPAELEETDPSFQHVPQAALPEIALPGAALRVVVGTVYGATSPVRSASPTFYVDAHLDAGAELALPDDQGERAIYVVDGAVEHDGVRLEAATMGVVEPGAGATVRALEPAHVMLLGGAPIGERHLWWNFVATSEARLERAKREWKDGSFPRVPGDELEFIPLPE